jgi:hypothetical protein
MTVNILPGIIVKSDTGTIGQEAAKLRAYRQYAQGRYVIPAVLFCDSQLDVMILERLQGYVSLQDVYLESGRTVSLAARVFEDAGRVLAHIHSHSAVTAPWVQDLLLGCAADPDELLLHGDFGFSNVLFRAAGEPLAVVDPSPPGLNSSSIGLGAPIEDLALMLSCILGRVPPAKLPRVRGLPRRRLMEELFRGYRAVRDPGCTFGEAYELGVSHLNAYLARRRGVPSTYISAIVAWLTKGV